MGPTRRASSARGRAATATTRESRRTASSSTPASPWRRPISCAPSTRSPATTAATSSTSASVIPLPRRSRPRRSGSRSSAARSASAPRGTAAGAGRWIFRRRSWAHSHWLRRKSRTGRHGLFFSATSSYSRGVACTAPGVGIISTVPDRPRRKGQYMEMSGTSMATPAAVGVLALILSGSPDYKKLLRGPARAKLARRLLARYCRSVGLHPMYQGRGLPALGRVSAAAIPRQAASSGAPRRKRAKPSRRRRSS